jgi:hypothetical protein
MSRIIFFRPLNNCGSVRLDLDSCPWYSLPIFWQNPDSPDFPEQGDVESVFYQTPEGRWVEHLVEWDHWQPSPEVHRYREVSPIYVADCLAEAEMVLPDELAACRERADAAEASLGPRRSVWILRAGPRTSLPESMPVAGPFAESVQDVRPPDPLNPLDPRDEWLYLQRSRHKKLTQIQRELERDHPEWEQVASWQGIGLPPNIRSTSNESWHRRTLESKYNCI